MRSLAGLRVLVTGAGQNIGLAIARAFLAEGARVLLNDLDPAKLLHECNLLESYYGDRVRGWAGDVCSKADAVAMVAEMVEAWGGIDICINNAGIYPESTVLEMAEEEWDRVLAVNAKGTFLVSQAAARQLVAQGAGGQIINISSGSWKIAQVGYAHYCASKAAVVMFSQTLAMELARHGIQVNVIAPGFIENEHVSPEYKAAFLPQVPAGRLGVPEDVAKACLMLAAGGADYMTGQTFQVDGGLSAGRYSIPLSDGREER